MSNELLFTTYGTLALSHLGIQIILAHADFKRNTHLLDIEYQPSVGIVVPVYNEDSSALHWCLQSIYDAKYPNKKVIVVDDGSTNITDKVVNVNAFGFDHIVSTKNIGKRNAQKIAFDRLVDDCDIIITVDSDTVIAEDGIKNIVQHFKDPAIGAVTGEVKALNKKDNLLTKLIYCRYWNAFNQERAAQSLFGVVMCCSGPFAAYRSSIIKTVKEKYVRQTFFGVKCTFGDDRHLTNLVLNEGYKVKYADDAKALTYVPTDVKTYLKQQLRWSKSFAREAKWTVNTLKKHHFYLSYDLLMQVVLPVFLLISLIHLVVIGHHNLEIYIRYGLMVLAIAAVRSLYGFYRTKDPHFFLFVIYGFIYIFLLLPLRLYALVTVNKNGWGTR